MKNLKVLITYIIIILVLVFETIIESRIRNSLLENKILVKNKLILDLYVNVLRKNNIKYLKKLTGLIFKNYNALKFVVVKINGNIVFAANEDSKFNTIFNFVLSAINENKIDKTDLKKFKLFFQYRNFHKYEVYTFFYYDVNFKKIYLRNFIIGFILILFLFIKNKMQGRRYFNDDIPEDKEYEPVSEDETINYNVSNYKDLFEDNKKLSEEVENLTTFREVGLAINSILNFNQMLREIMNVVISKMNIEKIVIYLIDFESNILSPIIGRINKSIIEGEAIDDEIIKIGFGNIGSAMAEHYPIVIKDFEGNSMLICPLIAKSELIGAIKVVNKLDDVDNSFSDGDKKFLQLLSSQIALALNNARLYEMAITDGLTKLYVHRHFQFKLEEEINRSRRSNEFVSLIMLDIDHFKKFNDNYGHQVGDLVLMEIGKILKNMFRVTDSAFRYGGEEMAVILPNTDSENAYILSEDLRKTIMNHDFITADNQKLKVTVSLGVATYYSEQNITKDEFIKMADRALYYSKEHGRNRTTAFTTELE